MGSVGENPQGFQVGVTRRFYRGLSPGVPLGGLHGWDPKAFSPGCSTVVTPVYVLQLASHSGFPKGGVKGGPSKVIPRGVHRAGFPVGRPPLLVPGGRALGFQRGGRSGSSRVWVLRGSHGGVHSRVVQRVCSPWSGYPRGGAQGVPPLGVPLQGPPWSSHEVFPRGVQPGLDPGGVSRGFPPVVSPVGVPREGSPGGCAMRWSHNGCSPWWAQVCSIRSGSSGGFRSWAPRR